MSDAFIGDIKLVAFNFAPKGWALCNGQLLPINQNQALFSLLGTQYGGNGQTNFALPNLQGRTPIHAGAGYTIGEMGGEVAHTLTISEMPAHTHVVQANGSIATQASPVNAVLAGAASPAYGSAFDTPMAPAAVSTTGGSQPHPNMPPYLTMNYVICLSGIFPSQN
jgi:microcystin-dependent protein